MIYKTSEAFNIIKLKVIYEFGNIFRSKEEHQGRIMTLQSDLQSQGWNLSQEGIDLLSEGLTNPSAKDIIKKVWIISSYIDKVFMTFSFRL